MASSVSRRRGSTARAGRRSRQARRHPGCTRRARCRTRRISMRLARWVRRIAYGASVLHTLVAHALRGSPRRCGGSWLRWAEPFLLLPRCWDAAGGPGADFDQRFSAPPDELELRIRPLHVDVLRNLNLKFLVRKIIMCSVWNVYAYTSAQRRRRHGCWQRRALCPRPLALNRQTPSAALQTLAGLHAYVLWFIACDCCHK